MLTHTRTHTHTHTHTHHAAVVLFWGVYLFHNAVLPYMMATLVLFVLANVGFLLLLEVLKRNQRWKCKCWVALLRSLKAYNDILHVWEAMKCVLLHLFFSESPY